MNKRTACLRRAKRTRKKIRELGKPRLTVHRTAKHIYAQLIVEKDGLSQVLAAASTAEKALQGDLKGNKVEKAKLVGKTVAERILKAGVKEVAFDRSGFKFHGRIKALADAAREVGVIF